MRECKLDRGFFVYPEKIIFRIKKIINLLVTIDNSNCWISQVMVPVETQAVCKKISLSGLLLYRFC